MRRACPPRAPTVVYACAVFEPVLCRGAAPQPWSEAVQEGATSAAQSRQTRGGARTDDAAGRDTDRPRAAPRGGGRDLTRLSTCLSVSCVSS